MAGFLPPVVFEIKALTDKAMAEFKEVNKELEKMEGTAQKAGGSVSGIDKASKLATGAVLAMGAAFAGFAALGIKEAIEAEGIMTRLNATMSAAGINTAKAREQVSKLSESFVQLGFDDEEASGAMENLIRMTGDLDKSQKLLVMSADLARAKNISLTSASTMLARAATGNTRIFKQMGITLDDTLPKSEALKKAMDQLQTKIGGQAQAATKTFAVQVQILKEQFNNAAQSVGMVLLPMLKKLIEIFNQSVAFISKYKTQFQIFAGVILTITLALAAYNVVQKVSTALTKAWTVVTTIQKTVMSMLTGQQLALNAAMKLNPIGLIVAGVMLLIGAFVLLWNKCEPFRKIMIEIGKVGLKAMGGLIQIAGVLATGYLKIVTGPLKLLLKGLSLLGVDAAGKALKGIESATDGVGKFFDGAAKKVTELSKGLDKFNKPIKLTFGKLEVPNLPNVDLGDTGTGTGTGTGTETGTGTDTKKAMETLKKDNEGYMKIVDDLNKKIINAKDKFNDKMAELEESHFKKNDTIRSAAATAVDSATKANIEKLDKLESDAETKRFKLKSDALKKTLKLQADAKEKIEQLEKDHADKVSKLNKDAADKIAKLEKDSANKISKLRSDAKEKIEKLEQDGAEKVLKINQDYANKVASLTKKNTDDLSKLGLSNQEKLANITKSGSDKLLSIVKQSVDRLRGAYEKGTEFKLGDIFKGLVEAGNASADQLVTTMRTKLDSIKLLAKNAAQLAELGFSQTFIEQVVGSGDELGNQLASSIIGATPETISELRSLYGQIETQSSEGLNALANNMSIGASLATKELTQAYADAQKDTAEALAAQATDYLNSQIEINKAFSDGMTEAKSERDAALVQAAKDMSEAIASTNRELAEAIAEVQKDLLESTAAINQELVEALAEAEKDLAESIAAVNKDLADAIAEIDANLVEALAEVDKDLKDAIAEQNTAFTDTLAEIQTNLDTALADEMTAFADAQEAARTALSDALDGIVTEFQEKLATIDGATATTTAAINAMVTALNAARDLAALPMPTPTIPTVPVLSDDAKKAGALSNDEYLRESKGGAGGGFKVVVNAPITNYNTTSDTDTSDTIIRLAKFGIAVI
jgi:hypothetical protein